jgi:hypothetical protein
MISTETTLMAAPTMALCRITGHLAPQDLGRGRLTLALQPAPPEHEDDPAEGHADASHAEPGPPADRLSEGAAEDSRPEGAEVHAVIVEGEAWIAPGIALGIELANDGGDVGLQVTDAHDDERQRQIEDIQKQGVLVGHRQGIGAFGQLGGQGRSRGQALDREALVLAGADIVEAPADLDLDVAARHAPLHLEGVGVAAVGQHLGGGGALDR